MIKPIEFLRTILPAGGYYAIVGIKNKRVRQKLINDLDAVKALAQESIGRQEDIYFGCSSYVTPANRTKNNVAYVKAFWIDLDCGEDAPYETQQDGFDAIKQLCKDTKLPRPWIVNSGRGLHVYWPFTTPILAPLWTTYATRLVELCAAAGLSIKDPGCSTDAARILRIPNSYNFKDPEEPLDVMMLCSGAITPWENLRDLIQAACGEVGINGFHEKPAPLPRRPLDPVTAALLGNVESNFTKIAKRSMIGAGCAQIEFALRRPAETPEPLWRGVLSIAQVCDDRDKAIHKISEGHPGYDVAATERKANETGGPYKCETFAAKCDASLCAGCVHKGVLVGPIQLGKVIARALDPIIVAEPAHTIGLKEAEVLPALPWPYFRGKNGGIYSEGQKGPDGSPGEDIKIYEYNLDVVRRLKDPEKGETLIIHLALPKDGIQELAIPLADAQSIERMKDKLGFYGVAAGKDQMTRIGVYITQMVKHMQAQTSAEPARSQMGWTEDRTGIVWGRTMFTKNELRYCPPSSKATTVANMMRTNGTLDAWESVANRYAAPGSELYACCMLAAFGSMLNHYTYEDPVWVHLVSSESGTGKTTLTQVINSIWGDPVTMGLTVVDTANSVEKRRVAFNSMAICQDEITNMPVDKLSQIAYSQSQGREKLRLTNGSQEMVNNDRRDNTFFSNGNKYISDALSAHKTNAAGEYARLIEIAFAPLKNVVTGDDHFGRIKKNYGHAGPLYAQWLVSHETELQDRVDMERRRFENSFKSVSKERNWVGMTAAMFAAGRIIQDELGLLKSYDLDRMYAVWVSHMLVVRERTENQIVSHENLLGDFINENYANIIIPDAQVSATIAASPTTASIYGRKTEREARNKLVIRWEKDTQKLYIVQNELKAYCIKRCHSFIDLVTYYHTNDQFIGIEPKRMGSGTGIITSPVKTLAFKVTGELGAVLQEVI